MEHRNDSTHIKIHRKMSKKEQPTEHLELLIPATNEFMEKYPKLSHEANFEYLIGKMPEPSKEIRKVYKKEDFRLGVFTAKNLEPLGFEFSELCNEFRYAEIEVGTTCIMYIDEYEYKPLNIKTIAQLKQFIKIWYGN